MGNSLKIHWRIHRCFPCEPQAPGVTKVEMQLPPVPTSGASFELCKSCFANRRFVQELPISSNCFEHRSCKMNNLAVEVAIFGTLKALIFYWSLCWSLIVRLAAIFTGSPLVHYTNELKIRLTGTLAAVKISLVDCRAAFTLSTFTWISSRSLAP